MIVSSWLWLLSLLKVWFWSFWTTLLWSMLSLFVVPSYFVITENSETSEVKQIEQIEQTDPTISKEAVTWKEFSNNTLILDINKYDEQVVNNFLKKYNLKLIDKLDATQKLIVQFDKSLTEEELSKYVFEFEKEDWINIVLKNYVEEIWFKVNQDK